MELLTEGARSAVSTRAVNPATGVQAPAVYHSAHGMARFGSGHGEPLGT